MLKISEAAVHVVGADSRTAVAQFDEAYVASLRLAANAIDGLKQSGLPVSQSQRLYRTFNESFGKLMEGRAGIVSAISQLTVVHRHSNQAEVDAGCGAPWEDFFTTGQAETEVVARAPASAPAAAPRREDA